MHWTTPGRLVKRRWTAVLATLGVLCLSLLASVDLVVCQKPGEETYLSVALGNHCAEDVAEHRQQDQNRTGVWDNQHPEGCVETHLEATDLGDNQQPKTPWLPGGTAPAVLLSRAGTVVYALTGQTTHPRVFTLSPTHLLQLASTVLRR